MTLTEQKTQRYEMLVLKADIYWQLIDLKWLDQFPIDPRWAQARVLDDELYRDRTDDKVDDRTYYQKCIRLWRLYTENP